MFKKVIWPLVLFSSIALLIVFIAGFMTSVYVSRSEEKENTRKTNGNSPKIHLKEGDKNSRKLLSDILILGDSIGFGVGDEEKFRVRKKIPRFSQ